MVARKLLGLFAKSIKRVEVHEFTKTWQIDDKWHVKPSIGPDGKPLKEPWKSKTLKVFNTKAEANAWAKKRSNMSSLTPKQKKIAKQAAPKNKITGADFAAMREYEKKSMVGRLDEAKSGMTMQQRMKKTRANEKEPTATMAYGMGKKKKPKAVMYGGGMGKKPKMAVMAHGKKKDPMAAMPGYHMQKRDKY